MIEGEGVSADDSGFLGVFISSLGLAALEKRARLTLRFCGVLSTEEGAVLPAVLLVGEPLACRKKPMEEGPLVGAAAAASRKRLVVEGLLAAAVNGLLVAVAGLPVSRKELMEKGLLVAVAGLPVSRKELMEKGLLVVVAGLPVSREELMEKGLLAAAGLSVRGRKSREVELLAAAAATSLPGFDVFSRVAGIASLKSNMQIGFALRKALGCTNSLRSGTILDGCI